LGLLCTSSPHIGAPSQSVTYLVFFGDRTKFGTLFPQQVQIKAIVIEAQACKTFPANAIDNAGRGWVRVLIGRNMPIAFLVSRRLTALPNMGDDSWMERCRHCGKNRSRQNMDARSAGKRFAIRVKIV